MNNSYWIQWQQNCGISWQITKKSVHRTHWYGLHRSPGMKYGLHRQMYELQRKKYDVHFDFIFYRKILYYVRRLMACRMDNSFALFLDSGYAPWRVELPGLSDHIERIVVHSGEYLPCLPGDIYFVGSGTFGKYERNNPVRYIAQQELVFIPLERHHLQLLALEKSVIYFIDRKRLYELSIHYPTPIILYDLLRERHQKDMEFRMHLLTLHKRDRLEVFQKRYAHVLNLVSKSEIARYLCLSREYLRNVL